MRRSPLHRCRKAARYWPLPLQPLPAAIRERLLDSDHRSAVTITGGTADFEDVGSSGLKVLRRYCPRGGSPLFTVPDVTPDLMMVKAGGIDSNEWFHPIWELFVGQAGPGWRRSQARRSSKAIRTSEEGPR